MLNHLTRRAGSCPGAGGYVGRVDSSSLTEQQAEALRNRVGGMLGYVGRMMKRMQLQGWPPDDPVYERTRNAEKVLHELHVRLIYLAAPAGTAGRPALRGMAPQEIILETPIEGLSGKPSGTF